MFADAAHGRHVVTDKQNRATLHADVAHLLETLLLKLRITDRQHFGSQQRFRLEMRRNTKREPHVHAARITLHGGLKKLLALGKTDDLVELPLDPTLAHAEDRPAEIDA